jgi:hypothetical protein
VRIGGEESLEENLNIISHLRNKNQNQLWVQPLALRERKRERERERPLQTPRVSTDKRKM